MHKTILLGGVVVAIVSAMLSPALAIDSIKDEQPAAKRAEAPSPNQKEDEEGWPAGIYAPYVDVTLWPTYDISATAREKGLTYYTLAFITACGKKPCWGGYAQYDAVDSRFSKTLKFRIEAVRNLGGDVIVSFGGTAGVELANAHADVATLTTAYQSVIDAYNLTCIDFDIEGAPLADKASVSRRSRAMAALQRTAAKKQKKLRIWLTLPVLPSGLTNESLTVVKSAIEHGVDLAGVNIMAMDYGNTALPEPEGQMGNCAIEAATNTVKQLAKLYGEKKTEAQLWRMIGITPMIGMNNQTAEVFTQNDARKLLAFAKKNKIGLLSIWSLTRDRPHKNGAASYVSPKFSSIKQMPFEFSLILQEYRSVN